MLDGNGYDMDKSMLFQIAKNDVTAQETAQNLAGVIIIDTRSTDAWVMPSTTTTGMSQSNTNMGGKLRQ